MTFSIRRLLPDDESGPSAYEAVAPWFENEVDLATPDEPSDPARVHAFLADPTVLFWLAELDGSGFCWTSSPR